MPAWLSLQPSLETSTIRLVPLQEADFDELYAVAADPKIWEQHPNKDRWRREVFATFFEGAVQSGGAFKIVDKETGATMGSTRLYDYSPEDSSILIGYTFYGTKYWGRGINLAVKALLLDYLFEFVDTVRFHIGAGNVRSQIAIQRLGATKVAEQELAYYGEQPKLNFVFEITKPTWAARNA
ncbi:GNAT family N-acetyltransferase [Hymenobacter cellulosilyticus]|uniref:GNAT family N-acetyltransferase n=1 Tax=Hymenobacter cellulosilyticus TaxID=2932248 RepID=A0A8T9QCH5_9BACT|nr:GNAT family N-acetyltransferase [Hymenobacter cellulosilyticus]UOQ74905.1 GNAT family N-acetyltransferase [Hymenobacter cellulosilyticus]